MPCLKAWDQGSEAPAHLQLRQCPNGAGIREGRATGVADLIPVKTEMGAVCHCPTAAFGDGRDRPSERGDASVADLIRVKT